MMMVATGLLRLQEAAEEQEGGLKVGLGFRV